MCEFKERRKYLESFLGQYHHSDECTRAVLCAFDALREKGSLAELIGYLDMLFIDEIINPDETYVPHLKRIAADSGVSERTVYLIYYILGTDRLAEIYDERGIDKQIQHDCFMDYVYKITECHMLTGLYGLYSTSWFYGYFRLGRFALGRMQYDVASFAYADGVTIGSRRLEKGDKVLFVHIPSSPEPFDTAARLDSYRKAYEFFKGEFPEREIPFVSKTWLFHPANRTILKPTSNIVSFMDEFMMLRDYREFHQLWRIFGKPYSGNPDDLPEENSLQRGYKEWIKAGNAPGSTYGVMLFDGEKIINE